MVLQSQMLRITLIVCCVLQPGLKWEANAMVSSDGEVVPYERPVYLDGPVEVKQN